MSAMNGYYINLAKREDRNHHMQNLTKHPFFKHIERFNAIEHKKGAVGCTLSHIECLKTLSQKNDDYYMLLEDDFCILNQKHFDTFLMEFDQIKDCDGWDLITLTPRGDTISHNICDNFHRITNNQTTTGYIIKHRFISTLLPVFEASVSKLENGGDPNKWALDSCWKPIQLSTQFWYHNDVFAGQLPGYSDIEKRQVNYNQRFVMQNRY
jgi:glycosyl transferase family 25